MRQTPSADSSKFICRQRVVFDNPHKHTDTGVSSHTCKDKCVHTKISVHDTKAGTEVLLAKAPPNVYNESYRIINIKASVTY